MANKRLGSKQSKENAIFSEANDADSNAKDHTLKFKYDGNSVLSKFGQEAQSKWSELPSRDKIALVILIAFLILIGGGYGGYLTHKAAIEEQENYQTAVNDFFWLRSQASNITPSQNNEQLGALDQRVLKVMNQMGALNSQALSSGDDVQISFSHANQNTVSNILGSFINSGLIVKQLNMQQDPDDKIIKVQATISQ